MSSTSSGPASVDEILRGAGLDGLGKDPASEAVRACIERLWSRVSTEDKGQQALVRGEALKRLNDSIVLHARIELAEEFWTDAWPLGKLTDEWPLGKITDTYPKAEGFSGGSG